MAGADLGNREDAPRAMLGLKENRRIVFGGDVNILTLIALSRAAEGLRRACRALPLGRTVWRSANTRTMRWLVTC